MNASIEGSNPSFSVRQARADHRQDPQSAVLTDFLTTAERLGIWAQLGAMSARYSDSLIAKPGLVTLLHTRCLDALPRASFGAVSRCCASGCKHPEVWDAALRIRTGAGHPSARQTHARSVACRHEQTMGAPAFRIAAQAPRYGMHEAGA